MDTLKNDFKKLSVKLGVAGMAKYQKGELWKGNRNGRPRKPEIELVRQAMEEAEIEKKKSLWQLLIEKCYEDNNVLIAVAKKFLPDKIEDESAKGVVRTILVVPKNE